MNKPMRRIANLIFASLFAIAAQAQVNGDGFYRVKNVKTQRYISVIDNKGSIDKASVNADLGAIQTIKYFDRVATDPGSVIYLKKMGSEWDLVAQGTSVYDLVGITIQIIDKGSGIYQAFKSYSGFARYLFDLDNVKREVGKVLTSGELSSGTQNWYILPITNEEERYLAVEPTLNHGNYYYQTYFASYGFTFNNTNDKAFYITTVEKDVAVYKEITGTIPANTPVIIRGQSNVITEHKITPIFNTPASVTGNKLTGTFFNSDGIAHENRVANDATIRVLGVLSDGSLGFKRDTSLDYVPHNTAYLKVASTAPNEIKLLNEEEYKTWKEQERLKTPVTLTAVNITREYGETNPELTYTVSGTLLGGKPALNCAATASSPVGTYPITITRGDVVNTTPTLVNGTLTITPATLTAKVGNITRAYGDENPAYEVTYEGWKNVDTQTCITTPPHVTTEADVKSDVGEYVLTLEGGAAQNYTFKYINGQLTVTPASLMAKASNSSRAYGVDNPTFKITYEGWRNGDTETCLTTKPVIKTEADIRSNVGEYALIPEGGTAKNYVITYTNGTLTITQATIMATVEEATREYGDENPTFSVNYTGWKNGDTETCLTRQAVVQTEATKYSHVGSYVLTPAKAESMNYNFYYINGTLTVTPAPLTISIGKYQREQEQENPTITPIYEGFKNDDTAADLEKQPVITIEATADSPVGTYPIIVSGAESRDYNITYINGTLEVTMKSAIGSITTRQATDIHRLNGTLVRHKNGQGAPLSKGIYIIGGRKVVVK